MFYRRAALFTLVLLLAGEAPLQTAWPPLVPALPETLQRYPAAHAFLHDVGMPDPTGWHADYRAQRPGYLVSGLADGGDVLPEGTYEYDFYFALRGGALPGLLSQANDIARVEAYDTTVHERLLERRFQRADFPSFHQRRLVRKTLIFSTWNRAGHRIEPRIYWPGLAGVFLEHVDLRPLATASTQVLADRAAAFEASMEPTFLDRGQIVLRDEKGHIQDQGDAAIWTGLYAASEAWRYRVTHDPLALSRMERSLWALHNLYQESPTPGTLVRYIDADGNVWPLPPSKDTYTGFVFGLAQALPVVRSPALRRALRKDLDGLAGYFLDHDLMLPFSKESSVDLNPYLPADFFPSVLRDLRENTDDAKRLQLILRALQSYFWLQGERPVPSLHRVSRWLKHPEARWEPSLVDLLNDSNQLLGQVQHNVHRSASVGNAEGLNEAPYAKLDLLLLRIRRQINALTEGRSFQQTEQLKIRPSEALLALHLIKMAAELSPKPNRFDDYYQANLWKNKALLQTALDWCQMDEDLIGNVLGETTASANRSDSSHITFLALYDLVELEKDPYLQFQYKTIFERQVAPMRSDGNAMLQAMENRIGLEPSQWGLILWSLTHYPVDRAGRGDGYWQAYHRELTDAFGSVAEKALDPLPADLRPRDAFIWQRSARSIRGDQKDWLYPPMDYLFAYWLARITEGPPHPSEEPPDAPRSLKMTGARPRRAPLSPSP